MTHIPPVGATLTTMQFHNRIEVLLSFLPTRVVYAGINHMVFEMPDIDSFMKAVRRLNLWKFYCEVPQQHVPAGAKGRFLKVRKTWP